MAVLQTSFDHIQEDYLKDAFLYFAAVPDPQAYNCDDWHSVRCGLRLRHCMYLELQFASRHAVRQDHSVITCMHTTHLYVLWRCICDAIPQLLHARTVMVI